MLQINEILTTVLTLCQTNLPALLTAAGLDNFDAYDYGPSQDSENNILLFYRDSKSTSFVTQQAKIIIQIQLYATTENGFNELTAAKYEDVVSDYIWSIDPHLLGLDNIDNIDTDSWTDVNNSCMYSFIMPTWYIENDNCDIS